MEEQTRTKRRYLCTKNSHRGKKMVDMEAVYKDLDHGKSLNRIAAELGVSRTTLYRRHKEYQKEIEALERETKVERTYLQDDIYEYPPLP